MIVVMKKEASRKVINQVVNKINKEKGLKADKSSGAIMVICVIGKIVEPQRTQLSDYFLSLDGVEEVKHISKPYKLASKEFGNGKKVVIGKGNKKIIFGGKRVIMMAGPCAVESYNQMDIATKYLAGLGVNILRGGAFKPRTNPYGFEGLGEDGLKILQDMRKKYGMFIVTELLDPRHAELFLKYVDIIQIGTRNMQNFELLKVAGDLNMPVIIKRGMSATVPEWLGAAEYVLGRQTGDKKVILCARGIRTFEIETNRNTPDICTILMAHNLSWLPVIFDPSHAVGITAHVPSITLAAIAARADGLLIEVHPKPLEAKVDGQQSLSPEAFTALYQSSKRVARAVGRTLI